VENILREEVEFMKEHNLEIFDRTESEFKVVLDINEGVPVKGKIDRIDVDRANKKLYVADYKTSQIPTGASIKSGEDIQLAVYIMAMALKQPNFDYDGYYISIKDLKHSPMGLLSLDKAKEYFSIHGFGAIKGLQNGVFSPAPMDTNTCEKCNYRRCCGAV
jgi:ATP-dependent helicase/DNAse subunit B